MFDIKSINLRYFQVKLSMTDDDGEVVKSVEIEVEPPKVKILKRLTGLTKSKENTMEELTDCIKSMLNKNKQKVKVDEYVEDMSFDEMQSLILEYFKWLSETKNLPN